MGISDRNSRQRILQQYLSGNPYPGIPKVRAIMLGRDMDMAYRLLTSTGGHKKAFFSLDTSYEHFHYVPNTPEGELLLKVLCSPLLQKRLNQLLRSDLLPPDRQLAIEHDALTSEKMLCCLRMILTCCASTNSILR